ncbi:MAG: UPF0182 family protein [Patescibacteria group bacterium]|jgi:hypothetical protein
MSRIRRVIFIIIALAFLGVLLLGGAFRLITDWWWFQSINHTTFFTTILSSQLLVGFGVALFSFLFVWVNLLLVRRFAAHHSRSFTFRAGIKAGIPQVKTVEVQSIITRLSFPLSLLIGIMMGFAAASQWDTVLLFMNQTAFHETDPLFGRDVAYYVFTLPFLQNALSFAFTLIVIAIVVAFVLYNVLGVLDFRGGIRQAFRGSLKTVVSAARRHLALLVALYFFLVALKDYFVDIPNLVYSAAGSFTGAGYTDVTIRIPLLQIGAVLASLVGAVLIIHAFRSSTRQVVGTIFLYFFITIIGGAVVPGIVQRFIVSPNELVKEEKYIAYNIAATQAAYGVDTLEKRDLSGDTSLTQADLEANSGTIRNIRLWERAPLLDTFGQIQEIRTYYDFVSLDNDRYTIDGELRQTLLSPRELSAAALPQRNFINEHLTFTHGFGLTLGPVNEVTPEGLPVLFIKDLPPASTKSELDVTRPEIYYGELANDFVVVNTDAEEFNYPSGEENVFSTYEGEGGVPVNSLFRKLLFALRFGSNKLFFSNDITTDSKIMFYRDIHERVRRLLPFLKFDQDPYLVVREDGSLTWMYDAYTTTNRYPYAERRTDDLFDQNKTASAIPGTLNYIRNSVKITIDAYDGSMTLYTADAEDPLIQTYAKIFDDSFVPLTEMPEDLRSHIRYPEDIYRYQADIYSVYHMEEPQIFYNKEDEWQIPTNTGQDVGDPIMRHLVMSLPDEENEEFILMLPYTPRGKDNLAAWMVARNDGENYGELVVYRFPKQELVFGPTQIRNRINQNPDISRQISLWDQRGSEVIQGSLLVIPIESSLLYVQPLYLRAEGGRIPELKRVIVANGNNIAMAETLDLALAQLFTDAPLTVDETVDEATTTIETTTNSTVLEQAQAAYERALAAQKRGDWATYGTEITLLGELLGEL